jgi:predicted O-methyltransferase YrrM
MNLTGEKLFISKLIFPIQGWLSDDEASTLFWCAQESKTDIMEIGGYCGKSTIALLCGNELGNNVPVWCIDRFDSHSTTDKLEGQDTHEIFWDNISERNLQKHLRVIVDDTRSKTMHEQAETFELGMLFHDAGHSYEEVKHDLNLFLPQVIKKGYVCVHDFNPAFPGVVKAVNERKEIKKLGLVSCNMWVGEKC